MRLEKRVDVPLIYDREVFKTTIDAIPKIMSIKKQKEDLFIKDRILSKYEENKDRDLKFIKTYERLLHNHE